MDRKDKTSGVSGTSTMIVGSEVVNPMSIDPIEPKSATSIEAPVRTTGIRRFSAPFPLSLTSSAVLIVTTNSAFWVLGANVTDSGIV